jgi:hypothetical protein
VALCQARISTKPLWGFSSSNPYHSQSRAEQVYSKRFYQMTYLRVSFFKELDHLILYLSPLFFEIFKTFF